MKKIIIIIILGTVLWNCSENEIKTYDGKDFIYFSPIVEFNQTYWKYDTLTFSFAAANVQDTIFQISVTAGGKIKNYDRSFRIDVKSTGVEGVHYEPLLNEYILEADSAKASIPIHLHLTNDMLDSTFFIHFELKDNEYFTVNLPTKYPKYDTVTIIEKVFEYSAQMLQPTYWNMGPSTYFGYFSPTKVMTINSILGFQLEDWNNTNSNVYKRLMVNGAYFKDYVEARILEGPNSALKDPHPSSERGYLTVPGVTIPEEWPDAW